MWAFDFGNVLLEIMCLLFSVYLIPLYVALLYGDRFYQWMRRLLSDELVEVSDLETILEHPHKHLLVLWDDLDDRLIK